MSCVFVWCSWAWVVWTLLGRSTEAVSVRGTLCGPAQLVVVAVTILIVRPIIHHFQLFFSMCVLWFLYVSPTDSLLGLWSSLAFPSSCLSLVILPIFSASSFCYVSVNFTSFQKPSSSIPFSRRSSLVLSLPHLLSWGSLPVHLLGSLVTLGLIL